MANKKDIGNLNNKEFGVQLDPKNELRLEKDDKKGQQAYYKNQKMDYLDYVSEVGARIHNATKGKGLTDIGSFSGFGNGTLKKPYKEIN
tara:strand:- start:8042 stop:8308 length:267 start_codon:yes stop_codon:yes gene_type:complete